jgi:hypothetical protein
MAWNRDIFTILYGFDQRVARQQLCKHGQTRINGGACVSYEMSSRNNEGSCVFYAVTSPTIETVFSVGCVQSVYKRR